MAVQQAHTEKPSYWRPGITRPARNPTGELLPTRQDWCCRAVPFGNDVFYAASLILGVLNVARYYRFRVVCC